MVSMETELAFFFFNHLPTFSFRFYTADVFTVEISDIVKYYRGGEGKKDWGRCEGDNAVLE